MNNNEDHANPNVFANANNEARNTSKIILEISKDAIPSMITFLLAYITLKSTSNFCDPCYPMLLKAFMFLSIAQLLYMLINVYLISLGNRAGLWPFFVKSSALAWNVMLNLGYYFFVIYGASLYKATDNSCILSSTFPMIVLYTIIVLGIIDIFRNIFYIIAILIGLPIFIKNFLQSPGEYLMDHGIDPEIIDNIPTIKAESSHCKDCVICCETIKEKDDILVLNCEGKHCFHSFCIKEWLKRKFNCPLCKSYIVI